MISQTLGGRYRSLELTAFAIFGTGTRAKCPEDGLCIIQTYHPNPVETLHATSLQRTKINATDH